MSSVNKFVTLNESIFDKISSFVDIGDSTIPTKHGSSTDLSLYTSEVYRDKTVTKPEANAVMAHLFIFYY